MKNCITWVGMDDSANKVQVAVFLGNANSPGCKPRGGSDLPQGPTLKGLDGDHLTRRRHFNLHCLNHSGCLGDLDAGFGIPI